MKFTLGWLLQFLNTNKTLEEILDCLISVGLEVESVKKIGDGFIVAKILEAKQHPNADKLSLCNVFDGKDNLQIVCGAHNARAGIKVVLAQIGAVIPANGMIIKKSKIRQSDSFGMLCSGQELSLNSDGDGIIELGDEFEVGNKFEIDPVIEISVTPNRGDALCVYGIARDLAAAGFGTLNTIDVPFIKEEIQTDFKIEIENNEICKKFSGIFINGIENKKSPEWLVKKLESAGLKTICALVDIANYIMLTYGTPMHVYDAAKIEGNTLIVRRAKVNENTKAEEFYAIDGKKYAIPDDTITICDSKNIQCIAGIIGSKKSECALDTKSIFLECANFNYIDIATTKRKIAINTESSYRFERQIDSAFIEKSLKIAAEMILSICGGKCSNILNSSYEVKQKVIDFNPEFFKSLTGLDVSYGVMGKILSDLGFTAVKLQNNWRITPPTWRNDIETQNCIVEEILRIYGYDKLKSQCLYSDKFVVYRPSNIQIVSQLMVARGFHEVITWSFMDQKKNIEDLNAITIDNPVTANLNIMRPTILYNLLDVAESNYNNGIKDIKIFEAGPIYRDSAEINVLTGLRAGKSCPRNIYQEPHNMDFFDAKADFLALLDAFYITSYKLSEKTPSYYHPKRSAAVLQSGVVIGYIGEAHPKITNGKVVPFFELFVDLIRVRKLNKEKCPSKFPVVERDFGFVFKKDKNFSLQDIKDTIKSCSPLVKSIELFDRYQDDDKYKGMVSLAFSITIESDYETLKSEQIEEISEKIISRAHEKFGAVLRRDFPLSV